MEQTTHILSLLKDIRKAKEESRAQENDGEKFSLENEDKHIAMAGHDPSEP